MKSPNQLMTLGLIALALGASSAEASTRKIPNLGPGVKYLTYYGVWGEAEITAAHDTRLVITMLTQEYVPSKDIVGRIQAGRDGKRGTSDDVSVIAYLSIGEDAVDGKPTEGDKSGPTRFDATGKIVGKVNGGVASYYVDACRKDSFNPDGKPDLNGDWGSFFVNPGDPAWRQVLKTKADELINVYGADGLFLDTLDTATQDKCENGGGYAGIIQGARDTIKWLYDTYSTKYLIANRGFALLESAYNIRPYISALMTENHFTEWEGKKENGKAIKSKYYLNKDYDAITALINSESQKPDGFQVLILDYMSETQSDCSAMVKWQTAQAQMSGNGRWMNFLTPSIDLDSVGFVACKK